MTFPRSLKINLRGRLPEKVFSTRTSPREEEGRLEGTALGEILRKEFAYNTCKGLSSTSLSGEKRKSSNKAFVMGGKRPSSVIKETSYFGRRVAGSIQKKRHSY